MNSKQYFVIETQFSNNKSKKMEFGELVEPDTRAFWDDYDELDVE